jgi:putative acetyltransferase
MEIQRLNPEQPEAQALITESDAYMVALYPAESNHLESAQMLKQRNILFLGVYIENQLVACGAVKILRDADIYGEIKRIFVKEEHRGKGLSKAIMRELEAHLIENAVNVARLETGIKQPEALGLYKKIGYIECEPFGSYKHDPLSVFMEKSLREK